MTLRLVQIAMNARDDSAVGRFWAEALGWSASSEEPGVTNVEPAGFAYPAPERRPAGTIERSRELAGAIHVLTCERAA
jgi:hypothetical protein